MRKEEAERGRSSGSCPSSPCHKASATFDKAVGHGEWGVAGTYYTCTYHQTLMKRRKVERHEMHALLKLQSLPHVHISVVERVPFAA